MTQDSRKSWEKTIEEYLDGCSVGPTIERIVHPDKVRAYAEDSDYAHIKTSPLAPDYAFHINGYQDFKIVHTPTGEVSGTFVGMMAYVAPEHRGKGLTSLLYVMCDDLDISRTEVRTLTPASLGAFRKAHAMMVERAVKAGDPVPLRVLTQYRKAEGGGIELRNPYGPEECNARLHFTQTEAEAAKVLATAATQDESFVPGRLSPDLRDLEAAAFYPDLCRARMANGLRVAAEAAKAGEGTIRMIVTSYDRGGDKRYEHLAFGARVRDKVIDAFGVTPEADWADKLKSLGLLGDKVLFPFFAEAPVTPEVHEFATAGECLTWMRAEGVRFKMGFRSKDREVEEHALRMACDYAVRIREPENAAEISRV